MGTFPLFASYSISLLIIFVSDNLVPSRPKVFGKVQSDLEDLAFRVRSSRESEEFGRRVCLSEASYAAAEKIERRMALKI